MRSPAQCIQCISHTGIGIRPDMTTLWLITDNKPGHRSQLQGLAQALAVGPERQRAWHQRMGMMAPVPIELPETFKTLTPPVANWKDIATMTIVPAGAPDQKVNLDISLKGFTAGMDAVAATQPK